MDNLEIKELMLENVMGDRFGRYSKYIIQDRALPDIRDGLKPVQRRILYAMDVAGNTSEKGFRKSAKTVGNVIGNYHPHGDSSVYEAMVRLSQDWKMREVFSVRWDVHRLDTRGEQCRQPEHRTARADAEELQEESRHWWMGAPVPLTRSGFPHLLSNRACGFPAHGLPVLILDAACTASGIGLFHAIGAAPWLRTAHASSRSADRPWHGDRRSSFGADSTATRRTGRVG